MRLLIRVSLHEGSIAEVCIDGRLAHVKSQAGVFLLMGLVMDKCAYVTHAFSFDDGIKAYDQWCTLSSGAFTCFAFADGPWRCSQCGDWAEAATQKQLSPDTGTYMFFNATGSGCTVLRCGDKAYLPDAWKSSEHYFINDCMCALCHSKASGRTDELTGVTLWEAEVLGMQHDAEKLETLLKNGMQRAGKDCMLRLDGKDFIGYREYSNVHADVVIDAEQMKYTVILGPQCRKGVLESAMVSMAPLKRIIVKVNEHMPGRMVLYLHILRQRSAMARFKWHTDTEQTLLPIKGDLTKQHTREVQTLVMSLSDGTPPGMQVLGFDPFFYRGRGSSALFNSNLLHRTLQPTDLNDTADYFKVAFFIVDIKSVPHGIVQQWQGLLK